MLRPPGAEQWNRRPERIQVGASFSRTFSIKNESEHDIDLEVLAHLFIFD
jgi:hypothetical protein